MFLFAKKYNLNYSRYADDLAFSGSKIPYKLVEYIYKIIEDCGFEANNKKTYLHHGNGKRIVTGISIATDEIKVPREYKRELKKEIYFIKRFGLLSHISKRKIKNPDYLLVLIGKLRFLLMVEPNNTFALEAISLLESNKKIQ